MTRPSTASGPLTATAVTRTRRTSERGIGASTSPLSGTPSTVATGPSAVL